MSQYRAIFYADLDPIVPPTYHVAMKTFRKILATCFWTMLSMMITMVIVFSVVYSYMELQLPNVEVLKDVHWQVPLRVYSADGKLIAEYGAKRRIPVKLDQIPKQLIDATLATEDARYYHHPGVDFISLIRAAKAVIQTGRKVQGAGTITMQVARNFFLTHKKTYTRKIKEILLALKIDKELSKNKVLELYFNKIYYGNRAYGVAAAARVYYGKRLNQLNLAQLAMIAGLPQAPSVNNPIQNPRGALARRNHVLARMLDVGYITKATYQKTIKAPVTARYHGQQVQLRAPYVAEMVRQMMVDEFGRKAYEMGLKVYVTINGKDQLDAAHALQDGLLAYTQRHGFRKPAENLGQPTPQNRVAWQKTLKKMDTVDRLRPGAVMQVGAQSITVMLATGQDVQVNWSGLSWARPALRDGYVGAKPTTASNIVQVGDVVWLFHEPTGAWRLTQIPKAQGAIVVLNPMDGAILALDGGFDYSLSNFNRATMAERQPGSNFKPFVYSAALSKGFTLASTINDAPVVINDSGENALWRPMNDTRKFYGPTRVRVGLQQSRNLVSIRLLQLTGVKYAVNYIKRFGFDVNKLPHTLSLALGSGVVTPLHIAQGYSTFANGGFAIKPYFIQKITEGGQLIYQATPVQACPACIDDPTLPSAQRPQPEALQVLTPQNAYLMTQAMRGVITNGTGRAALSLDRTDLAGKTGTTNQQMDAWFSGFDSKVEATVWVGFDNMTSVHEYGAQAALPIWINFMRHALKGIPESTMPRPANIVTVRIDPKTGLLATPDQRNAIFEVFRRRYEPTQFASTANNTSPYNGPEPATQSAPLF